MIPTPTVVSLTLDSLGMTNRSFGAKNHYEFTCYRQLVAQIVRATWVGPTNTSTSLVRQLSCRRSASRRRGASLLTAAMPNLLAKDHPSVIIYANTFYKILRYANSIAR